MHYTDLKLRIGYKLEHFGLQRCPVIASSGAGCEEHFSEVFEKTDVEAALAAGIFHREEVPIEAVKEHMRDEGIETR